MKDITVEQLMSLRDNNELQLIFFYTTMCGTCQLAEKMLYIVEETLQEEQHIFKCNVNYIGDMATELQIESVPCLIAMKNGVMEDKLYAFQSVDFLYNWIKRIAK